MGTSGYRCRSMPTTNTGVEREANRRKADVGRWEGGVVKEEGGRMQGKGRDTEAQ